MRKRSKIIRGGEEMVGLMCRVKKELGLELSDPQTTNIIAKRYMEMESKKETMTQFFIRKKKGGRKK